MKTIKTLLIYTILLLFLGCGNSNNSSNTESYTLILDKISNDYSIYLKSQENRLSKNNILVDGLYIYTQDSLNVKSLHLYEMEELFNMDYIDMKELIKKISIEAPRKNVLVVVADNSVDLLNYKSIDDIVLNGHAPNIEAGSKINSTNKFNWDFTTKLIIDAIRIMDKSSFVITTRQNINDMALTEE